MDPTDLRAAIPALDDAIYLNTGASGPSPRRVVEAAETALEHQEYDAPGGEGMYTAAFDVFDRARAAVADHVGATETDVALTESTTDGIGRIAAAMDWDPGDAVVRTDLEHAAGILPWRGLRETHGIEVRIVETENGRVDLDAFTEAVSGAKLAVFSSLTWTHGTNVRVRELTDVAHDAGARVLVDAVQAPGQQPVDVESWGADAVAASSHKWLLGVWGGGFLYVRPEFARSLVPAQVGYMGATDHHGESMELYPDARRFEAGTVSPAPYAALVEAIAVIEEVGYDAITDRIETLTGRLKAGLDDDRLVSPREFESGLLSVTAEDPEATVERLESEGIYVRSLPRPDTVRASLHAFNTPAEVDALLEHL